MRDSMNKRYYLEKIHSVYTKIQDPADTFWIKEANRELKAIIMQLCREIHEDLKENNHTLNNDLEG